MQHLSHVGSCGELRGRLGLGGVLVPGLVRVVRDRGLTWLLA